MPRITIGLPVFNGAALIDECLENLAHQSHVDFEVIISDNASTDGTSEICARFCDKDPRFRHIVHPKTTSANQNFLFARDLADCDYFAFRAYDDLAAPDFLERLSGVLSQAPTARLAVGSIRQEFEAEKKPRKYPYPLTPEEDLGEVKGRILQQMWNGHASWFYGLWRHQELTQSYDRVLREYDDPWGCDHLIILHAMLQDGVRGVQHGAEFTQRVLRTPRHYIPASRPSYAEMVGRNAHFERTARHLLEESGLNASDRLAVSRKISMFTYRRCHGYKRLAQAKMKSILRGKPKLHWKK